ncbi:hypothetical protein ZIOFF_048117 [Zingiber officinale]|uniref:O-methyltransferase dimerisation domain-containing protein n=1 Tax=Zingiber officinale TaxID=94328 RepID=A0A8J5FUI4_ZINOF|nr:hypothetical protein ZIOFF_048117 [Zingiber officinale]
MAPPQLSPEEEEQECSRAFHLSYAAALPMVLKTAIELGLLEMLVEAGPTSVLSSEELAARLPTTNPAAADMVERILRLLAANAIVGCATDCGRRKYSAAPICKYLVQNDDGGTVANLVLLHQDQLDLCMAAYTVGGKERTEEEFKALAKDSGFHGFNALSVFAGTWVLEFIK